MKAMSLAQAKTHLVELVNALRDGPVLLLRQGQPCAALVGLDERFDREAFSLGRNKRLRRLVDEACRRTKETGGIPFSEIVAEVEKQRAGKHTRTARSGASVHKQRRHL
jgi:antitoxin (DNA-binding transcriptional repressor) of toxin-antitoxin stability system